MTFVKAVALISSVAEAKVASTEVAMAATNQLFELVGPESLREKYGLDRHWPALPLVEGAKRDFPLARPRQAGTPCLRRR